jgi:tubulin monoglycylase TTLL3/8
LKTLIWYEDCDIDTFYPRCYDLGDLTDFEDFIEDFKINKVEYPNHLRQKVY